MTFLELVQRLASESGLTGAAAGVAAVADQVGMARRLVNWTADSHDEIQRRSPYWRWMRSRWTVNTVVGDDTYAATDCTDTRLSTPIDRFARWILTDVEGAPNVQRYLTSGGVGGEIWMTYLPYDYYRGIYRRGTQNNGPIIHYTVDPQDNILFGPKPDAIYTVSGEYQMSALRFTADDDEPEFPVDFHNLIWCKAMEKYGLYAAAAEVIARGKSEGGRLMRQLEIDQLPQINIGRPLA